MIEKAMLVASAVYAYASKTDNILLKENMNFTRTEFSRVRDSERAHVAQLVLDQTTPVILDMVNMGISQADLDELQTLINNYAEATITPKNFIIQRKTITTNLKALFKAADVIIVEQMDRLVLNLKIAAPDFHSQYKSSRAIENLGFRNTGIEGVVLHPSTHKPIARAKVALLQETEIGIEEEVKSTLTSLAGAYKFDHVPAGAYRIEITSKALIGIEKADIRRGKIIKINIPLSPPATDDGIESS